VENTHVVGFWGGDVLVPSDYDETGGVAKVDVSNIYEYSSLSFFFAYPIVPTSSPHIYNR